MFNSLQNEARKAYQLAMVAELKRMEPCGESRAVSKRSTRNGRRNLHLMDGKVSLSFHSLLNSVV